ncbi:MAG: YqhG family protein, partial [Bacilli bacterium]
KGVMQMNQQQVLDFLKRYFVANDCDIVCHDEQTFTTQLTIPMDKALMNRPFYWHYLEKTGGTPNPAQLSFTINEEQATVGERRTEFIHFGSRRLHGLFEHARENGAYVIQYEQLSGQTDAIALHPWLCCNLKVSYCCSVKKDTWLSLGIHLISGTIVHHFHSHMEKKKLGARIPALTFSVQPLITPKNGIDRLVNLVKKEVSNEQHDWAEEAERARNSEEALLRSFYENGELDDNFQVELDDIYNRHTPYVSITPMSGGLFYLHGGWLQQLLADEQIIS